MLVGGPTPTWNPIVSQRQQQRPETLVGRTFSFLIQVPLQSPS